MLLKKNQVAKKHKSLRLILRPSPLNKLGFNHKFERSFGNMDKKVPRVMTRVIWVMMTRVMPRVHASDPGRPRAPRVRVMTRGAPAGSCQTLILMTESLQLDV